MTGKSVKRPKNKARGCLYKRSKSCPVEEDPETENIPPLTPLQNKSAREIAAVLASQTPSNLNITAAAEHGSPISAPTISQTSVKGNITINQNITVVLPNTSGNNHMGEHHLVVKDGADELQMLSCKTKEILPKTTSPQISHLRRCLDFAGDVEQPTLTLAEVKKNTNYLREITVAGKIVETRPAIDILCSEEGMIYSHYALCDNTATVHLCLQQSNFTVIHHQWYKFKSLSICDFGEGNVLCSTEFTTLESSTLIGDTVQKPKETVISGEVTEALVAFKYFCSCGAVLPLSDTKQFYIKCDECKKSCRCSSVRNQAKTEVTIKQPCGGNQRLVLTDALLHSIVNFKKEGFCDNHQLEERLLKAKTVTVVCVDGEPRGVQMETVDKSKSSLKFSLSRWKHACSLL